MRGDHLLIAMETARVLEMGQNIHTAVDLPMLEKDGSNPKNLKDYAGLVVPADGFAQVPYVERSSVLIVSLLFRCYSPSLDGCFLEGVP